MGVGYPLMAPLHLFLWGCSFIFILEKERDVQVDGSGCWWKWEVQF